MQLIWKIRYISSFNIIFVPIFLFKRKEQSAQYNVIHIWFLTTENVHISGIEQPRAFKMKRPEEKIVKNQNVKGY